MDYGYSLPELEGRLDAARTSADLERALSDVLATNLQFRHSDTFGRALFARGLDAVIPRLARRLKLEPVPGETSNDRPCIVASRFYPTGGHSRVAEDLIRRLPERSTTVVLTQSYEGFAPYRALLAEPRLSLGMGEDAALLLSSPTLIDRVLELYMLLRAARPSRIFLLCHSMDIVAVLACWPFRDVVEFLHHGDHVPSLGATLPFSAHVDLTHTCHGACRQAGIDAVYAGMAVGPPAADEAPVEASGRPPGRIRIATCGSQHKYAPGGARPWSAYAAAALSRPDTELVHFGAFDDTFKAEVAGALTQAGVDPGRCTYAGWVPSLRQALVDHEIDVYLTSYPEGGGKANLEAMAAGLAVVLPTDADIAPLLRFSLPLRRWIPVTEPAAIPTAIDQALVLRDDFRRPEAQAAMARELARFDDYVALRAAAPA